MLIESGPSIPDGKVLRSRLRLVEVNRRERWLIGSVREFAGLGRGYRADPLRPGHIVELRQTAGAVEDEIVLKRHVADGNAFLRDERQVAVRSSDRKQSDEPGIDVRRGEPMKMTVIPVQSLRHVPGNVVGVRVGHPRREVQQHIVGISLRTDMGSVGVEIER